MLPDSRNTTYGSESPVLSADLDDIQDCIIGGKHGPLTLVINPNAAVVNSGSASRGVTSVGISGTSSLWVPIQLLAGQRVLAIRMICNDNATGTTKLTLQAYVTSGTPGGADTPLGTTQTSAGTGAFQTLAITGLSTVITASSGVGSSPVQIALAVGLSVGTAACAIQAFEIDIDHP